MLFHIMSLHCQFNVDDELPDDAYDMWNLCQSLLNKLPDL